MSAQEHDYKATGSLAGAWKIAAGVGAVGIGGALAMGAGDPKRFAFSYLFAFAAFLTLAVGATFFVLIQHVTSAAWSVTTRRIAEFFMSALPVFALLFVPVALHVDDLYGAWANHEAHGAAHAPAGEHAAPHGEHAAPAEHGGEHAAPAEHGNGHAAPHHEAGGEEPRGFLSQEQIEHLAHTEVITAKAGYLNKGFFFLRVAIYFALWILVSTRLFRNSTSQDASRDHEWTRRSQGMAPWAISVMALSTTFAAFDWYMSLLPSWYSTIFGVYHFAASMSGFFACFTLVVMWLRKNGQLGDAVTVEHFHDLGKLTFGFNAFWAYIAFSQFFLIWYAGIPEEAEFYHMRWSDGPWKTVSASLAVLHFVVPFVLLMSRNVKRNLSGLAAGAALIFVMHIVEIYWLVMPNYAHSMGIHASEAHSLSISPLDVLSFLGVGGVFFAAVLFRVSKHPLVALGDPRFERSRHFENA